MGGDWYFAADLTPFALIGFFLSLLAFPFASKKLTPRNLLLLSALLACHITASITYYYYTLDNTADAPMYYYDRSGLGQTKFAFGTVFMIRFTQFLAGTIGGTYFDYFIIFQAFGFWGIVLMMRTFEEIHDRIGVAPAPATIGLLFFPGLHFWSSALGKDAPMLLATSLATWAALQLRSRIVQFVLALGIMVLIRPHVALIAVMSLAIAAVIHRGRQGATKVILVAVTVIGAILISGTVESTLHVDLSSADSISDWIASKQETFGSVAGTTTTVGSFPIRLFSLMFRPMFIDAHGAFGLIASGENVASILMIAFLIRNRREAFFLTRSVYFVSFSLVFWWFLAFLLAVVYYNVGLGLRQRTMFMPPFFAFFVAQWAYHRLNSMQRTVLPANQEVRQDDSIQPAASDGA
jgi:hypothetical protein